MNKLFERIKEYNQEDVHYEAPYLDTEDMQKIEVAVEKQVAAKPIRVSNDRTDGCPVCETEFYEKVNFCPTCGKKMDWGD